MSKVDFLVPPSSFQPKDVLSSSHRTETLGALAYHGLLDPDQWLDPLVYRGAFKDTVTTFFHQLASKPETAGRGRPSAQDMDRARSGETWEQGPGHLERLVLWTLSQHTPGPSMGKALCELAMEQHWRFALERLTHLPGLVAHKAFGFEALFEKALMQQHWSGAVHILAHAQASSPDTPVSSVRAFAEQWKTKTLTHSALQGFLDALADTDARDPALWGHWLGAWSEKLDAKDFQAEQLIQKLVKTFETEETAEAQALVSRAHLALAVSAPVERVAEHTSAYAAYWAARHPGQLPPFSEALLERYSPDQANIRLLELGRRAACFSAMLDRYELATPEQRDQEHLQLYWIERAAFEKVRRQREDNPQPQWKQDRRETAMFEKRQERMERQRQRRGWTPLQLAEGLVAFYGRAFKDASPGLPNLGWSWLATQTIADELAWKDLHQRQGDQPSPVTRILHSHKNYILQPWLKQYREHLTQGMEHDPALPNALLGLLQALGSNEESRTNTRQAWEAWQAPGTWKDRVAVHLAGTLSFLVHHGMLDLRSETLDPVGGLDGIIVPLRELRLEQSLVSTADRPRPRM